MHLLAMGFFGFLGKLKPIFAPLLFVGKKLASLINIVLLTTVYFSTIAVTALAAKAFRKHFVELKPDKAKGSYWVERKKEDYAKQEAYRAF